MPDRGKLVVAAILAVALGLAVFAWYWRWQQGHRAAAFWGAEVSQLIRGARRTELLVLEPADAEAGQPVQAAEPADAASSLSIDGARYRIASTLDLSNSPGLIHARHSLTEDASFIWNPSSAECEPRWTHALRLSENDQAATLAFDFECNRIYLVEQDKSISVLLRITEGFQRIVQRAEAAQASPAR